MKFKFILFFLILMQGVYGQFDVNIEKNDYGVGETLQARIVLEELPINELNNRNIYLYRDNKIEVSSILFKLNDNEYYVYFDIPNVEEGNYSLVVELLYKIDNRLEEVRKSNSVNIIGKGLSIKPGLVILDGQNYFKINLKNNKEEAINVDVEKNEFFSYSKDKVEVPNGGSRVLYVYPDYNKLKKNEELILKYDNFSFKIPVLINIIGKDIIIDKNFEEGVEAISFVTLEDSLDKEIYIDQSIEGYIKFKNNLNKSLFGLEFGLTNNLNEVVELNNTKIREIKSEEILKQYLWINKEKRGRIGEYSGDLIIKSKEGYESRFPIIIKIREKVKEDILKDKIEDYDKEDDLEGFEEEEDFFGDLGFLDNETKEEVKEEPKGVKWIVIIVVILFIILSLYFIYSKSKGKESFKDVIEKVTKR